MSFHYKIIQDEAAKKMAGQTIFSKFIWVTPKNLPLNYPLKDQSPQGCCLPIRYMIWAEKIKNFKVYEDDVWIVTFPRSGTTWSQEMIYLLKNDLDYKKASQSTLNERFPCLELEAFIEIPTEFASTFQKNLNQSRPRLIKTHLPVQFLPDQIWDVNPKIIHVFRNCTKDVTVSFFHHHKALFRYQGEITDYVDAMVEDVVVWGPYYEHISGYLELSEIKKNVLMTRYEDMKKDLSLEIMRTAEFLGVNYNKEQILKLADHLFFDNMKKNKSVNLEDDIKKRISFTKRANDKIEPYDFIRKGEIGGWRNDLTSELERKIDAWSDEKFVKDTFLWKYVRL